MKFFMKMLTALLACVLLPCVAVVLVTNAVFHNIYQETIGNTQINRLRVVGNTNSLITETMRQNALSFIQDNNVRGHGHLTSVDSIVTDGVYPVGTMRLVASLSDMVRGNDLYESVYFYIDGSDYVVNSRNGVIRMERFPDLGWMDSYRDIAEGQEPGRFLPARLIPTRTDSGNESGSRCVTYIYPVTLYTSAFQGALVFNLYEERLLELYTAQSENNNITLMDAAGELYLGADQFAYRGILSGEELEEILASGGPASGYSQRIMGGEQYLCSWYRIGEGPLLLVSVDDMSTLADRQMAFQFQLFLLILILLPLASLLVVLVSRRLYSPIRDLARDLQSHGRFSLSGEKDELSAVSRAVRELMREDTSLFYDSGRIRRREGLVRDILAGKGESGGMDSVTPYFRNVCILAVPDTQGLDPESWNNFDTRIRLLARLIQEELSGDSMQATAIQYDEETIAIILSADDTVEDLEDILLEKIDAIRSTGIAGCPVTFSVGSLASSLSSVRQSFDEAKATLEYRFIRGTDSVLLFDILSAPAGYLDAREQIDHIFACLADGDKSGMLEGINALTVDIATFPNISFVNVTQILNQLPDRLIRYVQEHGMEVEELFSESAAPHRSLWRNTTLAEAGRWLCRVFSTVIDYQHVAKDSGSDYVERTLEYVNANFHRDINIDTIANHIGISYSYLRKIFKDATGKNLADYISDLRIGKAKELLETTGYTVKEIAALCGYNHERSFSRSFTQAVGISPGRYKATVGIGGV